MMKKAKPWLFAAASFLLVSMVAWKLPPALKLAGMPLVAVRVAIVLLGLAAAVLVLFLIRARTRQEPEVPGGAEIDETIAAAQARLASSNLAADARLGRLPLALVLGPTGSTKTSVITHCGLDPELLAGEVMRGDGVIATDPLNVWYAHGTVIVEAGGPLLEDAARWRRLVRHLQPRRLAAAIGRGRQAPRIAILCFACDDFVKPGASQNLQTLGRQLRARLTEASQGLGIRLPVYVLFTRADRLPYFADYVRSFTTDEAHQVVGATMPLSDDPGASWAERESRRLNEAFGRIVRALAVRRLDVLPRESQEQVRAGAYEFPRELRKIAEPAVQLLLDIFRPSQLGVNPFLRGFYFTGVRPVVIRDVGGAQLAAPRASGAVDSGATSVFNAALLQQALQQAAAAPGGGRKVPQWVFLQRLFKDVVLSDDVALNITRSGTRVDLLRRSLIGAAAAACLFLALGFTTAFFGNRGLILDSRAAAEHVRDRSALAAAAPLDQLTHLDSLRQQTQRVGDVDRGRRGLRLRSGLYVGRDVHEYLRSLYFDRLDGLVWRDTRGSLIDFLEKLPVRPQTNNFGLTQDALAAYLLTTNHTDSIDYTLPATTLLPYGPIRYREAEPSALLRDQLEYFSRELPHGNPYPDTADEALVRKTVDYLLAFSGTDAYYGALLQTANQNPALRFTSATGLVRNPTEVAGAFTYAGWRRVQADLDSLDGLFARYQWIYRGRAPASRPHRDSLALRYERDYVAAWQSYLRNSEIVGFQNAAEAATRLESLAAPGSPLVGMLALASKHTDMDTTYLVGRAFQPLHMVVTPNGELTTAAAQYTTAVYGLAAQLETLRNQPPSDAPMPIDASRVTEAVGGVVNTFSLASEASFTADRLRALLTQPVIAAQRMSQSRGGAVTATALTAFCRNYAQIASAYPFNRNGPDANLQAVTAVFRRDEGHLRTLYTTQLQALLNESGTAVLGMNPAREMQEFYTRGAAFSRALYGNPAAPAEARLELDLQVPPQYLAGTEIRLETDADAVSFSQTSARNKQLEWYPGRNRLARLSAGGEVVAEERGPWALFKLFGRGQWSDQDSQGRYVVTWTTERGTRVGMAVDFGTAEPVLRPNQLAALTRCPTRITN